jgi:hypothetical protein
MGSSFVMMAHKLWAFLGMDRVGHVDDILCRRGFASCFIPCQCKKCVSKMSIVIDIDLQADFWTVSVTCCDVSAVSVMSVR